MGDVDRRRWLGKLGEAEIEHLDAPVGHDHDVAGLQVAVGDALLMGAADRVGKRYREVEKPVDRQAAGRNHLVERLSLDELHGQEVEPFAIRTLGVLDRVDRDDVRVVERGDDLGLALEALQPLGIFGHVGGQHLQCDAALQAGVLCDIDLTHAAGCQQLDDLVGSQLGSGLDHGCSDCIIPRRLGKGVARRWPRACRFFRGAHPLTGTSQRRTIETMSSGRCTV